MSEGEKSEEPTAKRQEKYRKEGKVAVSRDVGGVVILAAAMTVGLVFGRELIRGAHDLIAACADAAASAERSDVQLLVRTTVGDALARGASALALFAGPAAIAGAVAGVAQTRGNFSTEALGFKWERVSLLSGLRRTLASADALQQIGLALSKAIVLGAALGLILHGALDELVGLTRLGTEQGLMWIGMLLLRLLGVALLASAALATADLLLSRRRMHEQMKMTKQEVKDEHKQLEGDPLVRARMRQRMRQIGRNRMIAATVDADVVVVNPTHYAVALTYQNGQAGAPKLVAKGKNHQAARIREVARRSGVPIVANPPVARAVYATTRVGHEIPPELYEMVARVLAYLFRQSGRRAAA